MFSNSGSLARKERLTNLHVFRGGCFKVRGSGLTNIATSGGSGGLPEKRAYTMEDTHVT